MQGQTVTETFDILQELNGSSLADAIQFLTEMLYEYGGGTLSIMATTDWDSPAVQCELTIQRPETEEERQNRERQEKEKAEYLARLKEEKLRQERMLYETLKAKYG